MSQSSDSPIIHDPRDRFDYIKEIDRGASSTVYHGFDKNEQRNVAIKIINIEHQNPQTIHNEIQILSRNTCPQITSYYFSFVVSSELWIIMEFLSCGSLFRLLKKCHTIPEKFIPYILKQLLLALKYLHQERQIHRDVKCSNLFVHHDGTVKLGDFGVTGQLGHTLDKKSSIIGTSYWMAPEVITQSNYDQSADIWSLGITAIELALGKPPHLDGSIKPLQVIFIIPKSPPPTLEGDFSDSLKDFVRLCLNKDPLKRSTAAELLEHEFVSNAELTPEWVEFVNFFMKEDSLKKKEDEEEGIQEENVVGVLSTSTGTVTNSTVDNGTEFTGATMGQTKTFYGTNSKNYNMNSVQDMEDDWNFTTKFVTPPKAGVSKDLKDEDGESKTEAHLVEDSYDVMSSVSDESLQHVSILSDILEGEDLMVDSVRLGESAFDDSDKEVEKKDVEILLARNEELERENRLLRSVGNGYQSVLRGLLSGEEVETVLNKLSTSSMYLSPLTSPVSGDGASSANAKSKAIGSVCGSIDSLGSVSTVDLLCQLDRLSLSQSAIFNSIVDPALRELLLRTENGHYDGLMKKDKLNNVLFSLMCSLCSLDGLHLRGSSSGSDSALIPELNLSNKSPNTVMIDMVALLTSFTLKDAEV